jgi:hypothetical protein
VSVHVAAWQTLPVHTPLTQSAATPHAEPAEHFEHVPPQSVSLSVPFLTKSLQDAVWQTLPVHTRLTQSTEARQPSPAGHAGQVPPPQSVPVSLPFSTESAHVAL